MSKWGCVRCEWGLDGSRRMGREKIIKKSEKSEKSEKRLQVENNNIYNIYKKLYYGLFLYNIYDRFVYFTSEISR